MPCYLKPEGGVESGPRPYLLAQGKPSLPRHATSVAPAIPLGRNPAREANQYPVCRCRTWPLLFANVRDVQEYSITIAAESVEHAQLNKDFYAGASDCACIKRNRRERLRRPTVMALLEVASSTDDDTSR
jgi:hypothetical protein